MAPNGCIAPKKRHIYILPREKIRKGKGEENGGEEGGDNYRETGL
jgi:hypothetical protein